MSPNNQRLLSLVERIERLEEEKRALAADIASIKMEAKSAGFDVKVINQMIKERRMSQSEMEEHLALAEIYRAALGMLNGTPLGEFARKRFEPPPPTPPEPAPEEPPASGKSAKQDAKQPKPEPAPEPAPAGPTEADIAQARIDGGNDMLNGKKITQNPWLFNDPRRAAWDEGWCAQAGTDGMDIPQAWRRQGKKPEQPGASP